MSRSPALVVDVDVDPEVGLVVEEEAAPAAPTNPRAAVLASLGPPDGAMTRLPGGAAEPVSIDAVDAAVAEQAASSSHPPSGASTPGSSSSWILLDEDDTPDLPPKSAPDTLSSRILGSWWSGPSGLAVVTSNPPSPTLSATRDPAAPLDTIRRLDDVPAVSPFSDDDIASEPESEDNEDTTAVDSVPSSPAVTTRSVTGSYIEVPDSTTTVASQDELLTPRVIQTADLCPDDMPSPSELRRQARVKESRAALKQFLMTGAVVFGAALFAGAVVGVKLWQHADAVADATTPAELALAASSGPSSAATAAAAADFQEFVDPYITGCTTETGAPCAPVPS